ncbi:MAG: hypothetical protein L3J75_12575 [Methylococcaceae bacterium]|nr:hypothetical protein [Methylococcaceae bacterium]
MNQEITKAFVTKADGNLIRIKVLDNSLLTEVSKLGFVFDSNCSDYFLEVQDESKKSKTFEALRDLDVYFSAGKEWCPAEVFEYLRDSGLLTGKYTKISWRSPNNYHLTLE